MPRGLQSNSVEFCLNSFSNCLHFQIWAIYSHFLLEYCSIMLCHHHFHKRISTVNFSWGWVKMQGFDELAELINLGILIPFSSRQLVLKLCLHFVREYLGLLANEGSGKLMASILTMTAQWVLMTCDSYCHYQQNKTNIDSIKGNSMFLCLGGVMILLFSFVIRSLLASCCFCNMLISLFSIFQ